MSLATVTLICCSSLSIYLQSPTDPPRGAQAVENKLDHYSLKGVSK